jgi:hypothetical protein
MAQQKFKVKIPKEYNPSERLALATEIIDHIIERTKSGKDKRDKDFKGEYSDSYAKSLEFKLGRKSKENINLTLSGEMLNALTLLNHSSGELTIGIPKDDEVNNAKAEGNIKGTYGQKKPIKGKKRDFMGISKTALDDITEKYPTEKGRSTNSDLLKLLAASELADSFLGDE